ncbi:MAG: hypothetical protein IJG60_00375 [Thermoguttaceae bacterium]|nr:hypothetical protein [Thermoguttaceae bacterium]
MKRIRFFSGLLIAVAAAGSFLWGEERLDREAIAARHSICSDSAEMTVPLGNGEFCFNADGTGLQTFAGSAFDHRAWFAVPLPAGRTAEDVPPAGTFQQGRSTGPDPFPPGKEDLFEWMTDSLHPMNLVRVRFVHADGSGLASGEVTGVNRKLDLWTGLHRTGWMWQGEPVAVETAVGDDASVAVRAVSPALGSGALAIAVDFPYPTSAGEKWAGDFDAGHLHRTELAAAGEGNITLVRRFGEHACGNFDYSVNIAAAGDASIERIGPNTFLILADSDTLDLLLSFGNFAPAGRAAADEPDWTRFGPEQETPVSGSYYETVQAESAVRWRSYWQSGGAIDLSESTDPRWFELERRIVLSQYHMKIAASGSYPPSEAGLLAVDQWRGRFHMEMVWWHLAHWYLWGRESEAAKPICVYQRFKAQARDLASQLGMKGYQWQKCLGPEGRTAPWAGNQVLLWKEPHPIFFAELDYRARPQRETLEKWRDLVEGTADYIADYAVKGDDGYFHLAPVMPPSEVGYASDTSFDLLYWQLGLRWAARWEERLGFDPDPVWLEIAGSMAPLPVGDDGLYLRSAEWPVRKAWEHPDLIGAFGMMPPLAGEDAETARKTLRLVYDTWDWSRCWGWDFPLMAMAAARLGEPRLAVDSLLLDTGRNRYDERGVCLGGPCPYLPGNGGLLYAAAMMCAGWDETIEGEDKNAETGVQTTAPGFPGNGWKVRWEGLRAAP